ncbi:MAG TPA: nuclear transport factor 2 family protein [Solirubrobacterales bacterium]|nr:nuclear transport factor 2 family protein [Solirubrobacterales bacterium]
MPAIIAAIAASTALGIWTGRRFGAGAQGFSRRSLLVVLHFVLPPITFLNLTRASLDLNAGRDIGAGMSASSDLVERYREALDAWNRRDLVWILEQASPEIEFRTAQLFPGIEPVYRGREGMVEFWTSFIEEPWALLRFDIEEIFPAGESRVLALLTFHGTERGSGDEVSVPYAHLATFEGEEVARIDAFDDWDDARRAAATER